MPKGERNITKRLRKPQPISDLSHLDLGLSYKEVFKELTNEYGLATFQLELELEVDAVRGGESGDWHYKIMSWCSWTGAHCLKAYFPEELEDVEGFHKCLDTLFFLAPEEDRDEMGQSLETIWQTMWTDEYIEKHPSCYSTFIRGIRRKLKLKNDEYFVFNTRKFLDVVELRNRLKKQREGQQTPHTVSKRLLYNAIDFAYADLALQQIGEGIKMTNSEKAAFFLTQLILGSRFKGIARTNFWDVIPGKYPWVTVGGLSKVMPGKESAVATRPLNLHLVPDHILDKMSFFKTMILFCRETAYRIHIAYAGKKSFDDQDKHIRANIIAYIKQVYPNLLRKGEGTHKLRKLYGAIAFETYGKGMKENGFLTEAFAHESFGPTIHYSTLLFEE